MLGRCVPCLSVIAPVSQPIYGVISLLRRPICELQEYLYRAWDIPPALIPTAATLRDTDSAPEFALVEVVLQTVILECLWGVEGEFQFLRGHEASFWAASPVYPKGVGLGL